jgi:threonine dehydrogenase-like Zn-dependent dehydrogenase
VTRVAFTASEYQADGSIRPSRYVFAGRAADGWEVEREGVLHLWLGPGYRLLAASHCGVCATDLARRHLPFRLPQVTGHELVARDDDGTPVVVEINASHAARGLPAAEWCAHCRAGLPTHCPERLVLGIHDLPGGFGPWILAPTAAVLPLESAIDVRTSTLVEPFAAALRAAQTIAPRTGERIAVVGPGRLGTLVVAALAAWRATGGPAMEIVAVGRRDDLLDRARGLGADETLRPEDAKRRPCLADVAIETTGSPEGLELALRLATREVHVKSTTGQPTLGLTHLTELVVDELSLAPLRDAPAVGSAVIAPSVPAAVRASLERAGVQVVGPADVHGLPLGGADAAVVTSLAEADAMIRPEAGVERSRVHARGTLLVADAGQARTPLLAAVLDRGLVVSTSRCGDFRAALALLGDPRHALRSRIGEVLFRNVLPAERLAEAFARAAVGGTKVVVTHPDGLW